MAVRPARSWPIFAAFISRPEQELAEAGAAFAAAALAVPATRHIHNVPYRHTLHVAKAMLVGELAYRCARHATAEKAAAEKEAQAAC